MQSKRREMQIRAFTSAAVNYLPKVRLLCSSIKKHHPEFDVYWAVADILPEWLDISAEPIDGVIQIEDLGIPKTRGWVFGHTIAELSTAIKPYMTQHLLDLKDTDAVLYFDPDMVLFSRLDDLVSEFQRNSILLTPHQTKPESSLEAIIDNEICSLRHGVFNLGFLGIRNDTEGRAFIKWWGDRLYHFCHESLDMHLWTDQKWANFAPIFFDGVCILKSSRFNVAPWNITTRDVSGSFSEGFRVDAEPLGFYHFTGFDSGAHKIMAAKYGGSNKAIMSLVKWYEREGKLHKESEIARTRWAFSCFSNGEPITKTHRAIYRMRPDLQAAFPDPFNAEASPDAATGKARTYFDWFSWCARNEHPDLFEEPAEGAPGDTKAGAHPPHGSARHSATIDWQKIRANVRRCTASRVYAGQMVRRALDIWRHEGTGGLMMRLYRR